MATPSDVVRLALMRAVQVVMPLDLNAKCLERRGDIALPLAEAVALDAAHSTVDPMSQRLGE